MIGPLSLSPTLHLPTNLLLAPLERVSYVAFRALCHSNGASMTYTEMIRAKSITAKLPVISMIDTIDPQTPTGLQLSVADPDELRACLHALSTGPAHYQNISTIDINLGCPKPEVVKIGCGPAMLASPDKISALFSSLRELKDSGILPNLSAISAKIRLGLDAREVEQKVYLPVLDAAVRHLDFLTVHPRHASLSVHQQPPNYSALKEMCAIAKSADLKIIGNADITSRATLERMLETGVDGAMIGRGAINNPWLFRHLADPTIVDGEWPTLQEVDEAEAFHVEWEGRCEGIKNKYVTFREVNFRRLRHFVNTGEMLNVTRNKEINNAKKKALSQRRNAIENLL